MTKQTLDNPEQGDIVEVQWYDHFKFKGDKIPDVMTVKTWGIFEEENEDGIAVVQNEVQTGGDVHIDRIMDALFLLLPSIVSIRIIEKASGGDKLSQNE